MTVVAGVDPSSKKLAVVIDYDDGRVSAHAWVSQNKRWEPSNCRSVYDWVLAHFGSIDPGVVWIEEPLVGRGGAHATIVQAFTSGAAQAALLHLGWDVRLVNVSMWKKHIIGNGQADKDAVGKHVELRWPGVWPLVAGDPDLIDAAAICGYGRNVTTVARHIVDEWEGVRG